MGTPCLCGHPKFFFYFETDRHSCAKWFKIDKSSSKKKKKIMMPKSEFPRNLKTMHKTLWLHCNYSSRLSWIKFLKEWFSAVRNEGIVHRKFAKLSSKIREILHCQTKYLYYNAARQPAHETVQSRGRHVQLGHVWVCFSRCEFFFYLPLSDQLPPIITCINYIVRSLSGFLR